MNKKEFCKKIRITEEQFDGSKEIGDSLDLRHLTSIPEGFNPTVGGYLDLSSETKYIGANVNIPNIPTPDLQWEIHLYGWDSNGSCQQQTQRV